MAGSASGPPFCPVAVGIGFLRECRPASLVNYLPGGESGPAFRVLKIEFCGLCIRDLIVMCRKYCLLFKQKSLRKILYAGHFLIPRVWL